MSSPMRHTAHAASEPELAYICDVVCALKTGECIRVSQYLLRSVTPRYHNDCRWTAPDRVLSNIIGSAYSFSYHTDMETGDVTFCRREESGKRYYKEPDHDVRVKHLCDNESITPEG